MMNQMDISWWKDTNLFCLEGNPFLYGLTIIKRPYWRLVINQYFNIVNKTNNQFDLCNCIWYYDRTMEYKIQHNNNCDSCLKHPNAREVENISREMSIRLSNLRKVLFKSQFIEDF